MARGFTSHDRPPDVPVVLGAGAGVANLAGNSTQDLGELGGELEPKPRAARSRPAKQESDE